MMKKFSNPHLQRQTTQTVSRADLAAEHDAPHVELEPEASEDVAQLEQLLKRSLGEFQSDTQPVASEGRTKKRRKTEKQNKRNQDTEVPDADKEIVSFRLFSSSAPKLVSLKPKPLPPMKVHERAYEDDDAEAKQRSERAKAAAVDFEWITSESLKPAYPHFNSDRKLLHVKLDAPTDLPALWIAQLDKTAVQVPTGRPAWARLPPKEKPSPHDFPADKICCPVLSVVKQDLPATRVPKRHSKKRTSQGIVPRQPPAFWRPPGEWAGKSHGYALGYEGSRPIPVGSTRKWKYRHDRMRSGITADLLM